MHTHTLTDTKIVYWLLFTFKSYSYERRMRSSYFVLRIYFLDKLQTLSKLHRHTTPIFFVHPTDTPTPGSMTKKTKQGSRGWNAG